MSAELAERIFNCLSDGYDDEEYKEEVTNKLYNEISQLDGNSTLRAALNALCDRIEDLEWIEELERRK